MKPAKLHLLDAFTLAYLECALWASTDNADETGGEPLDSNYGIEDIARDSLAHMIRECRAFQRENAALLERAGDAERNGHDYWLTRNHHGAGFWDRGYRGGVGQALTDAAHADGSRDLYVHDGRIWQA